jgi:hypothetical protein
MSKNERSSGPTAGAETLDALAFLARVVSHIPNKGQVLQRSYGWYANRTRGSRRQAGGEAQRAVVVADGVPPERAAVRRRWAELLRRIFAVDPLRCPRYGTPMRIVAFLTAPAVIDQILTHLRHSAQRVPHPRAPPAGGPPRPLGVSRACPRRSGTSRVLVGGRRVPRTAAPAFAPPVREPRWPRSRRRARGHGPGMAPAVRRTLRAAIEIPILPTAAR